eukprot:TRINITY_DN1776_c0_g1_i1.p1 TRINITY_DN1776_c0_g1~~TRINITY_DN1776_c0_g1_i1.p1  ORF type:complete len:489 (-),score=141.50 TRINITY_DN1776_c0_g1_i1:48-1514(-)
MLHTPQLWQSSSNVVYLPSNIDEVSALEGSLKEARDQCEDLRAAGEQSTQVLEAAMKEFKTYLESVQKEFGEMHATLMGSAVRRCVHARARWGAASRTRLVLRWRANMKLSKSESHLQMVGAILAELQDKFWVLAGLQRWRSVVLHRRIQARGRSELALKRASVLQTIVLRNLSVWLGASCAIVTWTRRHQSSAHRQKTLRAVVEAVERRRLSAEVGTWRVSSRHQRAARLVRSMKHWCLFLHAYEHQSTLTVVRLHNWHSAAVAARLATRASASSLMESEAACVAQQAVQVAERAEEHRAHSEVHQRRLEAAMSQLATQAKARELMYTTQLEAANSMLLSTSKTLEALEAEHTKAQMQLLESHKPQAELADSKALQMACDSQASEARVMRTLWKQAEQERALLVEAHGQVPLKPAMPMQPAVQLHMLDSQKERITQCALSLTAGSSAQVLDSELLKLCELMHDTALQALAQSGTAVAEVNPPHLSTA